MRIYLVLLLLAATSGISAQQLLFDKTIPEQNVPTASRLKDDIKSHYLNSRYVNQTDFLVQQDFFIAINSNLIVKSKFIKMHSYPSGSFSYEGLLEGPASGYITFSKYNDRTAGLIMLADGSKYMIDQVASNIFVISLSNESAFTQRESHSDFIEIGGPVQRDAATASVCDISACPGSSTIDMMVVYTQQAENSWGGSANTIANITQAVTNMNVSMTNSGINNVTFRLVHTAKVSYAESGDFSTDLVRLAGNGDGYMDNVHSLRDQYGADLVSMIIGSPTSSCGIGYLNTNPSSYSSGNAFNVSLYSCVLGNFTMAHESGHNMGLRHDWYVDASTTPCEHHHGYVNQVALNLGLSSPASARWRTIMAYNDRCSVAGFNCTRVNVWSNPTLTYNGDAMGVHGGNPEPSDEAWAFYRMACLVASFRPDAAGGGGGGETCSAPSGLSSSVSTSGATVQWSTANGAIGYDVDYKLPSSSTWINVSSNTPSIAVGIGGLSSSTVYDWRVRSNCSFGSSNYVQSQFTTQAISLPACNAPASLSTSGITASAATANWTSVSGATSYNVDYKPASSSSWINIANGTTSLSWTISGMQPTTSYDWRVRANCTSGNSNYTQTQFTTQALGSCSSPGGLSTSNITSSAATMNWSSVSGAFSYTVEYKPTFSGTWLTAASATYSTSYNLYGLSASTSYDWRVKANCSLSESSNYSTVQFSTSGSTQLPSSNCPGPYDVSTNGSISGAATIQLNTGINGTISPRSDLDHYKFNITSAGTITVSLTTLPANYNLALLNSNGTQIAISQNNGTQNETISINVAAGSYYAKVFPKGNANNAASCYTLIVQTGTASDLPVTNNLIVKLFPNPAGSILNVWMEGMAKNTEIKVYDMMGKVVMQQQTGNTLTQLNISKLSAGFYLLRVNDGKETKAAKFVKE